MAPVGAVGRIQGGKLFLSAAVLSADGSQRVAASDAAPPAEAESLGVKVADALLAQGAAELIASSRDG